MLRPAMGVQQVEGGVDKEMPSPNETVALVATTTARRVMLMMYCILIAFRKGYVRPSWVRTRKVDPKLRENADHLASWLLAALQGLCAKDQNVSGFHATQAREI